MKVLVTGAAGQLGRATIALLGARHEVAGLTRADCDLRDHDRIMRAVASAAPDALINCAAYNRVDDAEDDALAALEGNAFAVRSLARAAAECGSVLVHYSTDFVFDGEASVPYAEVDPPRPQSVYGQSKLLGEWFAADAPRAFVLRVESLFGGPHPRSSIDRIADAVLDGREARVFVDRIVSPSFVDDVVAATEALITGAAPPGLYHCVNSGHATWHEVGAEAARQLGQPARLLPVRASDVPLRAPRPQYCALSNGKLARAGIPMPTWQDALARYLARRSGRAARG